MIKLTKLSGKKGSSIPNGYWVTGYETRGGGPKLGDRYWIHRPISTSLGERWFDYFTITELNKIGRKILTTQNSRWRREIIS